MKYGKDKPSGGYIESALRGGQGPSDDIHHTKIARGQEINTAVAMDNVELAMDIPTSIVDEGGFRGGVENLAHSLKGATAVRDEGAAGPVKRTIIQNH